jgi:hypothetical protein
LLHTPRQLPIDPYPNIPAGRGRPLKDRISGDEPPYRSKLRASSQQLEADRKYLVDIVM